MKKLNELNEKLHTIKKWDTKIDDDEKSDIEID
jgi:hypothetical protein